MTPFEFAGPYRIGKMIGRGGMGTVYAAVHEVTGEKVAVKIIAAHVADEKRFQRRFSDEIRTLTRLKHRNIVTLIGQGEQCGQLFYSMELVEGESLQQKLRREKRLPWPLVLDMAIDICAALKHAHDFGAIHRDLKPANLLIDQDGVVKLVDFGVAKLFGSHDQTAVGSILGTADYMAPEQAAGLPVTPRTDLYSLGNVLYACFTGRPPFANRSLTEVLEALKNEEPIRVDAIVPDLPPEIAELVHDLLEKRPEDRPPTALAVMNRMKAIRAGLRHTAAGESAHDADTIGPQVASPTSPLGIQGAQADQATAASDGDSKTLGHFDEGQVDPGRGTRPSQPESEQLTNKATVPSKLTRSSGAGPAVSPSDESQPPVTRTHFRTVQDKDRHRSVWGHESQEAESNHFWHIFSIVALSAALLAAIGTGIWLMQPPSADELHEIVAEAQAAAGNDTELRNRGNQFVKLYPDDPRAAEVKQWLAELNIKQQADGVLQELQKKANGPGGLGSLTPAEQAFVEAMMEPDGLRRQQRLEHWLAVFGHTQEAEGETEQKAGLGSAKSEPDRQAAMVAAAQDQLQELHRGLADVAAQKAAELEQRLRWAQENLSPDQERRLLQGILALYADKTWARSVIEQAQKRLTELG